MTSERKSRAEPKKKRRNRARLDEGKLKKFIDKRLIDAICHPARAHVLATLNERVASPSEVANEIGVDVNYLNYHFEELEKNDFIELVGREPRRGFDEHFYRAKATFSIDNQEGARLPASMKPALGADLFQSIVDDATRALKAGTFDARNDRHLSWTPLLLDEKGWQDATAALNEALAWVLAAQMESAERLKRSGDEAITATVGIMGFETPSEPPSRTAGTAATE